MNIERLYLLKSKLLKYKRIMNNKYYLTIDDKKDLLSRGERIPLRVKGNGRDIKTIVKTRGTIESGYLKNKRMGL